MSRTLQDKLTKDERIELLERAFHEAMDQLERLRRGLAELYEMPDRTPEQYREYVWRLIEDNLTPRRPKGGDHA